MSIGHLVVTMHLLVGHKPIAQLHGVYACEAVEGPCNVDRLSRHGAGAAARWGSVTTGPACSTVHVLLLTHETRHRVSL